jgi:hypothetical protein
VIQPEVEVQSPVVIIEEVIEEIKEEPVEEIIA